MADLEIRLLGGFKLVCGEESINTILSPRLQSLLAYLVLKRGEQISRQHLAALFWPDTPETQSRTNLRHLLHLLNRAFPAMDRYLHIDHHSIEWRKEVSYSLDVACFEAAAQHIDSVESLRAAVDLYAGDLLPDYFDEWLISERERLKLVYLTVLDQLVARLEAERQYGAAIGYALRSLRHDLLLEETHRTLIRLYLLNGERAAGLRAYQACASILQAELGVAPSIETRLLYKQLLQGSSDRSRPAADGAAEYPLIGRQAEWQAMQAAWQAAVPGAPQVILISGEAGIGKTRLAAEMVHWAEQQNLETASSRCYTAGQTMPLAPIVAWLRNRPTSHVHPAYLGEAARLLPELQLPLPHGKLPEPAAGPWQRLRFFEALAQILFSCCPVSLLLLEDLQWCDHETLDWLAYLLRPDPDPANVLAKSRLCLVLTVRWEEAERSPDIMDFLHRLRSGTRVTDLALEALGEPDTLRLAASVAGISLNREMLTGLYRETEGNPLFIIEMIRANGSLRGGTSMPMRISNLVTERLAQITPEARELTGLAAIIGRQFSYDVIALASGLDESRLVNALDELWQRRIFREQGSGRYEFSHEKIRQVVLISLSTARMRLFHRRIAEALLSEAERSEDPAQATAKAGAHFEQAGLTHLAIQQYQRAAEESFARFANQEAVQLLNQALGLVEKMSHQNSTPARAAQRPLETGDPLGIVTLSLRALIEQAHEYTTG